MNHCHVCNGDRFHSETTSEIFEIDGRFLLVEGIPVRVCDRCGEETFDRATTERIRGLLHGESQPVRTIEVGVFSL
ncbi:MAG: YgiT-type zinc finger protein [Geitlerinemataceae cyanobacterium]